LAFLIAAVSTYVEVLPRLLSAGIGLSFPVKLAVSALILTPLGFVMGMPFPSGLRALAADSEAWISAAEYGQPAEFEDNAVEWAWAVNAASSVLGSVLAIMIALRFGLNITLASGGAAYIVGLALLPALVSRRA
jgi:hypothetical protein